jgi:hypothetical protein
VTAVALTPIEGSGNIVAVGYNNNTLAVRFASGALYHYADVPVKTYSEFMAAKSAGSYFAANIRNAFKATRQDI